MLESCHGPSMCRRAIALALLVLAPACTVEGAADGDLETSSAESELRALAPAEILGSLSYGQTSAPVAYTKTPRYRAFLFHANAGDEAEVNVKALTGAGAQVWVTDGAFKNLAASVSGALPHLTFATAGSHYVVFRSSDFKVATYAVSLAKKAPAPAAPPTWNVPSPLVGVDLPIELKCQGRYAPWSIAGTLRVNPAGDPNGRVRVVEVEELYSYPSAASMSPAPCRETANEVRCGDGSPTSMTVGRPYHFASYSVDGGKIHVVLRQTLLPSAPGQLDIVTCVGSSL